MGYTDELKNSVSSREQHSAYLINWSIPQNSISQRII